MFEMPRAVYNLGTVANVTKALYRDNGDELERVMTLRPEHRIVETREEDGGLVGAVIIDNYRLPVSGFEAALVD